MDALNKICNNWNPYLKKHFWRNYTLMLNLNLKSKFKKIIPASMAFAALLTVAPLSSFAAETDAPVKNNVVNFHKQITT